MNKYEVMYILSSTLGDGEKDALIEKFSQLVTTSGGTVEGINKWGNRRLAYPINFKNEGFYVLMSYSASPTLNAEIERQMRILTGDVMRFMITKKIINSKTPAPAPVKTRTAPSKAQPVPAKAQPQEEIMQADTAISDEPMQPEAQNEPAPIAQEPAPENAPEVSAKTEE